MADASQAFQELSNLQLLGWSKYIVRLLDSFVHHGPNGQHQCLVFELLGPTVNNVLMESCRYPDTKAVLRMSEQLLEAIIFIHDRGMIHGGNVNSVFYI